MKKRLVCIGLALASQAPQAHVVLGEFSDGALRICRQNTRRNALTGRVIPMTVNALEQKALPIARWSGRTGLWESFTALSAIPPTSLTGIFRG